MRPGRRGRLRVPHAAGRQPGRTSWSPVDGAGPAPSRGVAPQRARGAVPGLRHAPTRRRRAPGARPRRRASSSSPDLRRRRARSSSSPTSSTPAGPRRCARWSCRHQVVAVQVIDPHEEDILPPSASCPWSTPRPGASCTCRPTRPSCGPGTPRRPVIAATPSPARCAPPEPITSCCAPTATGSRTSPRSCGTAGSGPAGGCQRHAPSPEEVDRHDPPRPVAPAAARRAHRPCHRLRRAPAHEAEVRSAVHERESAGLGRPQAAGLAAPPSCRRSARRPRPARRRCRPAGADDAASPSNAAR